MGADAEGGVDLFHVAGNGVDREGEAVGDLFPAVAVEEEVEHGAVSRWQARDLHAHVLRPAEAV